MFIKLWGLRALMIASTRRGAKHLCGCFWTSEEPAKKTRFLRPLLAGASLGLIWQHHGWREDRGDGYEWVAEEEWEVVWGISDLLPIIFKILRYSVRDLTTIQEMLKLVWWDYFQAGIIRKIKSLHVFIRGNQIVHIVGEGIADMDQILWCHPLVFIFRI